MIPGTFIFAYDGNARNAVLYKLTEADLKRPKVSFVWVDAGDGRRVTAKFRAKTGGLGQVVFGFDVKGPKVTDFTAKTNRTMIVHEHGQTGMSLGKSRAVPGIRWDWTVVMPPTHAGFIKDVQTVLVDEFQIQWRDNKRAATRKLVRRHPKKKDPHVQVDGTGC